MMSHQRTNHNLKHACDICGATYARGKCHAYFYVKSNIVFLFLKIVSCHQGFALKDHIKEQHGEVGEEINQVCHDTKMLIKRIVE